MSGALCKVSSSRVAGGTGANARYILRDKACDRWETRHLPDHARLGWTEGEQKRAVADHLDRQAERGRGERRNYRVVLSFERPVDSDKALALAREFLDKTPFRDNPALLAVHRNTEHVHVHILLTARKTDGYKLDLDRRDYESFDKTWARIYERAMSRDASREQLADRHREAVRDREISLAEWRRRYGQLRREGLAPAEIRQIIGERPAARSVSVAATHIRRNEREKGRIAERLQAAGATLGRGQATLGKEAEHAGPAPRRHDRTGPADRGASRGPGLARRGERAADGPLRGVAGLAGRAGAAVRDHDRAAERGLAHFLRDVGGGVEREVDRIVRALAGTRGRQRELVERVERQLSRLERGRESGAERSPGRPGRLRTDCERVRGRLDERLGETAGRLTFKDNVYPLLRTLEKYLDRLSERHEALRAEFTRLKEHLWERYTGSKWNFRDEFDLKRKEDPEISFDRDLDLSRSQEKDLAPSRSLTPDR